MKKNLITAIILSLISLSVLAGCYIPRTGLYENEMGTRYYIKDVYQTGWQQIEGETYYFSKIDGYMVTESQKIGGVWYGFNSDGTLANGFLADSDGTRYYKDGVFLTQWQKIDGETYYFFKDTGIMATGDVTIAGDDYTFGNDGRLVGAKDGEDS